jgi:hypothetical protein
MLRLECRTREWRLTAYDIRGSHAVNNCAGCASREMWAEPIKDVSGTLQDQRPSTRRSEKM